RVAEEREAKKQAKLATKTEREGAVEVKETPRKVKEVGFKQMEAVSRVFVRTSEPARFNISEAGEKTIRVELENTRVKRRNDTRPLDTSFFPSAVAMVTPKRQGPNYVLEIKLREK